MDATTWAGTLEAAKLLGLRQRRQLLSFFQAQGYWDGPAQAPTQRTRDLGVVRPTGRPGEWEWDEGFVKVFAAYNAVPSQRDGFGWTPYRSCDAFRDGLRTMFRSPRSPDPDAEARRDDAYGQLQEYRFKPVVAWSCRDHGISAALRDAERALRLALSVLDPGHPNVRTGATTAWNALAELAAVPPDHPFIRYGIIPPSAEPASLAPLDLPSHADAGPGSGPSEWRRMRALALRLGYPRPAEPGDETNDDLLTVWEDGRPIALMDRQGMKWRTALTRLLESGRLGESPGGDHAARAERCTFSKVPADDTYTQPVLPAGRRAKGTAPTTDRTRQRHRDFLSWMGEDEDDHPLPSLESEARKVVDGLADLYGTRKKEGTLPASGKQVAYALDLAKQNGIAVAFDRRSTRKEVGDFLDRMRRAEEERGMVAEAGPTP